jgi:hypothetical protein
MKNKKRGEDDKQRENLESRKTKKLNLKTKHKNETLLDLQEGR